MSLPLLNTGKKVLPLLWTNQAILCPMSARAFNEFKSFRIKRKKPIQKWFDPADKSWAEPILQHQEEMARRPEPEPSMLHMVYRVKDHFTRPYWEKEILRELDLFDKAYNPVVVKNTPEMNEKLKQVHHLCRIKPVTFPYELPKDERDYKHCYLRENGEFVVKQRLDDHTAETEQAWAEVKMVEEMAPEESIWKMDGDTVKKQSRRILDKYKLNEEYFPEKYIYKFNQDGKEHRYTGNNNLGFRHRQDWY